MYTIMKHSLCVFFIIMLAHRILAETYDDIGKLLSDIMKGYNKHVRPVLNQVDVLQVNSSFNIGSIVEFDEVKGKMTVSGALTLSWFDSKMIWDPSFYNHTYLLTVPSEWVWTPDIIIGNSARSLKSLAFEADWTSVMFVNNGMAYWTVSLLFEVSSTVNIKYYPFDTQYGLIMFMSNRYHNSQQRLYAIQDKVDRTYYFENGEWELSDSQIQYGWGDMSLYQVVLILKRRPAFVVINIIMPMIILSLLNLFVFIIPAEAGERVSFAVTILLAITVFMTIVGVNIPKTSSPLSVLCYFIGFQVILSSTICICTIINLYIFHKDDDTLVPTWVTYLTRKIQRNKIDPVSIQSCGTTPVISLLDEKNEKETKSSGNTNSNNASGKPECEYNYRKTGEERTSNVTWKQVSFAVDKALFLTILICFMIGSIVVLFIFAFQENDQYLGVDFANIKYNY